MVRVLLLQVREFPREWEGTKILRSEPESSPDWISARALSDSVKVPASSDLAMALLLDFVLVVWFAV